MKEKQTKEQRILTEYALSASDDDLRLLSPKLTERMCGDLAEALNILSQNERLDTVLASASGPNELYDLCDQARDIVNKECRKRGLPVKQLMLAT